MNRGGANEAHESNGGDVDEVHLVEDGLDEFDTCKDV